MINGKIYVGVHKTQPMKFDYYKGSGKALKQAFKKYGIQNFKTVSLFEFDRAEQAYTMESLIVNESFVKRADTYNLVLGGGTDLSGNKKGCSVHNKGKTCEELYGVERSIIIKKQISDRKKLSKGTKRGKYNTSGKYDGDHSGSKNSQYGKKWIMNHELKQNKKCSQEEYEYYISNGWVCGFKFSYIQPKEQL
jgi:hypothetical protein